MVPVIFDTKCILEFSYINGNSHLTEHSSPCLHTHASHKPQKNLMSSHPALVIQINPSL